MVPSDYVKMAEIKVWTGQQDIGVEIEKYGVEVSRQIPEEMDNVELDDITITGKGIGNIRLGISFRSVFEKWMQIRIDHETDGGEKTTKHLGIAEDASLLEVIKALPQWGKVRIIALDGRNKLTFVAVKISDDELDLKPAVRVVAFDIFL